MILLPLLQRMYNSTQIVDILAKGFLQHSSTAESVAVLCFTLLVAAVGLGLVWRVWLPHPLLPLEGIPLEPNPPDFRAKNVHERVLGLTDRLGPIVQIPLQGRMALLVNDPQCVKTCLEGLEKGPADKITHEILGFIFGSTKDAPFDKQRHKLLSAVLDAEQLVFFDANLQDLVTQLCGEIDSLVEDAQAFDIKPLLGRFALGVLFQIGFEMDFDFMKNTTSYEELVGALNVLKQLSNKHHTVSAMRWNALLSMNRSDIQRVDEARSVVLRYAQRVLDHLRIKQQNESFEEECYGKYLLRVASDLSLEDDTVLAEIIVFILKGHEPVVELLVALVYTLSKHESVQLRCSQLISQHCAVKLRSPVAKRDSRVLPEYVEATIKEALRLFSLQDHCIMRRVKSNSPGIALNLNHLQERDGAKHIYPSVLCVSPGTTIIVNIGALHRSVENWGPSANAFNPDRWLKNPALSCSSAYQGAGHLPNELCFLPFSQGPKCCPGLSLTLWQARAVLSRLCRSYHFSLVREEEEGEQDGGTERRENLEIFFVHAVYG